MAWESCALSPAVKLQSLPQKENSKKANPGTPTDTWKPFGDLAGGKGELALPFKAKHIHRFRIKEENFTSAPSQIGKECRGFDLPLEDRAWSSS